MGRFTDAFSARSYPRLQLARPIALEKPKTFSQQMRIGGLLLLAITRRAF